jgi:hypothetical protein
VTVKSITPLICSATTACLLFAGCGSTHSGPAAVGSSVKSGRSTAATTGVPSEAQSAATGDIPDNQAFLTFHNSPAGYAIRYPEGWARQGSGADVSFHERGNSIRVAVTAGAPPTPASALAALAALRRSDATIKASRPPRRTLGVQPVLELTYTRLSGADPVTGKRLPLTIDRYLYAHGGKVAIVDLSTPKGVDNVDAYRMISRSFQWR